MNLDNAVENVVWSGGKSGPARLVGIAMRPLGLVYGAAARLRETMYRRGVLPVRVASAPVASVGNITLGGAGKTPLVMELARSCAASGMRPAILTRGYGGSDRKKSRVVNHDDDAGHVGDEALLMARSLPEIPVVRGASRADAGRRMIEAIVKYTCAESEINDILNLKEIRFEQLVEIVQSRLDKDLKIIEYYGECDKPNNQHFFLADMIKKGHFVMTTNFDFLIELALLQSGIKKEEIIPVITQTDFKKFYNVDNLRKMGKKPVYKIHGSTKNIITNENTKDSLIATIKAFGSNKEGKDIFTVEPFKRPLFENITKNRSLIVMGYSGSDDFDVVPT